MKKAFYTIILCVFLILLAGCFVQSDYAMYGGKPEPFYNPLYFKDEQQLRDQLCAYRKGELEDSLLHLDEKVSNKYQNTTYSMKSDYFQLADIQAFYAPQNELRDTTLAYVAVKKEYVQIIYDYKDKKEYVGFTWYRGLTPEVVMNVQPQAGAELREVTRNGIRYIIQEWYNDKHEITGYYVSFVVENEPYLVAMPAGYTEEEMFAFCEVRTIDLE